ncbi:MAG: GTP-binding protein [Ideonella sp.]|nr:GTP-binding protein [Ideonella sp.]
MRLPTHVIGGYLGAGKTTLVNQLLRQADGERIAVLVNDFGALNIDADLIVGQDGEVLSLAGGCVCCSFGSDLVGTLAGLQRRAQPPQRVLIETSGVGLPAAVARSARLAPGLHLEGIVVVADALTLRAQATDRYVGDTVRQQLADADLLLLNKADAIAPAALAELRTWLRRMAPQAACAACVQAQVPADLVYGTLPAPSDDGARPWRPDPWGLKPSAPAADAFVSHRLDVPPGADLDALTARLSAPEAGLLRAKGWVVDGQGQRWLVQTVGMRTQLTRASATNGSPSGTLVMIGLRGRFDPQAWQAP